MTQVRWIKFSTDTFDGMSFKRIKRARIEGVGDFRDKLTAVWFELLALAGKFNNGGFITDHEMAFYNYEDIAIAIDRNVAEVQLCIEWFTKNSMIEIVDNLFLLSNWEKYQNTEGLEKIREQNRIRQQKYRENQKVLQLELTGKNEEPIINPDKKEVLALTPKKEKNKEQLNHHFEVFWKSYPRKVSKGQAEKTFNKLNPDIHLMATILEKLELLKKYNWSTREKTHIPHASTWLNAKGWEDEIETNKNDKKKMLDTVLRNDVMSGGSLI